MNYLKFISLEIVLFSAIVVLNFWFDSFLSPPFTRVDLIASFIALPLFLGFYYLLVLLFKQFDTIKFRTKVIVSTPTFLVAAFITGVIMSQIVPA